jgi:CPA2 family monovalent cation:H+ antiporter-2
MSDIMPLRDAFVSVFFVSLGMLFDVRLFWSQPVLVVVLVLGFTLGKGLLAMLAAVAVRLPARAVWLSGINLAQFGEFGFVLLGLGEAAGFVGKAEAGPLLAAGIVSLFVAPVLIRVAPWVTAPERALAPLTRAVGRKHAPVAPAAGLKDHVVLVGFGTAGQVIARTLEACEQPFVALELNAATVRRTEGSKNPVFYADATNADTLVAARVAEARAVVVTINDPVAATRVVDAVLRQAPDVPLLVRTRYRLHQQELYAQGATDVVAEEVEASIEVLIRLLRRLELPRNVIDGAVRSARDALQTPRRKITLPRGTLPEHQALADLKVESIQITDNGHAQGRSIRELNIRHETHALIVAIRRQGVLLDHPDPTETLQPGDTVYLVGTTEAVVAAAHLLEGHDAAAVLEGKRA